MTRIKHPKGIDEWGRQKTRLKISGDVKVNYYVKITTDKYLAKEAKKNKTGKGKVIDKLVMDSIQNG